MPVKHFTFIMEQTLGHVPFSQNLRHSFEGDNQVSVDWIPVSFPVQSWLEKLPVIRHNWSLRGSLKARLALRRANRKGAKPDLYFFHTQVISLLSAGWLRGNTPVVISMDATPLNYDRVGVAYGHTSGNSRIEKFKFWLNQRAFRRADYLVTWSEWARQSLIDDYGIAPEKTEVIPPGTDLTFWQDEAKKANSGAKVRLLFVGGDFRRKGGQLLYDIFRQHLLEKCELVLVTKEAVEEIPGVKVYRNIAPNSPELQTLFKQSDVFVLPTEGDCLPVAITEALAAGLPIVSTRVGAIEEAVRHGENGFLITPGDGAELHRVLAILADDAALRQSFGVKSRELAVSNFDVRQNGRRLLELCKTLSK